MFVRKNVSQDCKLKPQALSVESHTSMKQEIENITECSICIQTFTKPKILPCIHTYCLKCLDGWTKTQSQGRQISCPLCRKPFTVPDGGLQNLPTNFFMEKLLEINLASRGGDQKTKCDNCDENQMQNGIARTAVKICVKIVDMFTRGKDLPSPTKS